MTYPLVIVAGAGNGLGLSLMNKFQTKGYKVVGLNRSKSPSIKSSFDIRKVDLTNELETSSTIKSIIEEYGTPEIIIHNTAELFINSLEETNSDTFENCWRSMVLSAFILSKLCFQPMVNNGGGTFIVSGATASLRGGAKFSAFASAKFALRGLTQSLAREYQPLNIHVVHTILDGIINTENSKALHNMDTHLMMNPNEIAEVYWGLSQQPKSTWMHECDLRPYNGSF